MQDILVDTLYIATIDIGLIGLIIVSFISNRISGGRIFENFTLFCNPNIAFRDLSHINDEFSEKYILINYLRQRTMVPRYLYLGTCSINFPLKWTSKLSTVPKHIHIVLVSFTIILLCEQNFWKPMSCIWSPSTVSENRIRSSPHKIWAIKSSGITKPNYLDK